MNNLTVNMTELKELTRILYEANYPMLIRGGHGIGKSEFVSQLAKEKEMTVVEMRASQMTEGDLVGLPFKGEKFVLELAASHGIDPEQVNLLEVDSTEYCPPSWFLKACCEGVILLFDEVDRATIEIRQGLFQMNDSRCLNGFKLHPETRIYACVNGGINSAQYQVADMDPAELDRYTVFDLVPTVEEWLEWAREENLYEEVIKFIEDSPLHLEQKSGESFDPGVVYPSRRSWKRFSDALNSAPQFKDGVNSSNAGVAMLIGSGFVGSLAAQKFRTFALNHDRIIDPTGVFENGDMSTVANLTILDIVDLIKRTGETDIFIRSKPNKEKVFDNACKLLDLVINKKKAIEALEAFLEAMVDSARQDSADEDFHEVILEWTKYWSDAIDNDNCPSYIVDMAEGIESMLAPKSDDEEEDK